MDDDNKLENILRKAAIGIGIAMLVASIYLSYDGFDQSVSGGNPNYTIISILIGVTIAIAFTLVEFIVSSRIEGLNSTLKWLGVLAYGYSIWTNYIGLQHLLGMDMKMAAITAAAMDVLPEQMIAWGLGEAVMHDLFGNLGKFAASPVGKSKKGGGNGGQQNQHNQQRQFQNQSNHQKSGSGHPQFQSQGKGGGSNRRMELEKQFHMIASDNNNGHKGREEEREQF